MTRITTDCQTYSIKFHADPRTGRKNVPLTRLSWSKGICCALQDITKYTYNEFMSLVDRRRQLD